MIKQPVSFSLTRSRINGEWTSEDGGELHSKVTTLDLPLVLITNGLALQGGTASNTNGISFRNLAWVT